MKLAWRTTKSDTIEWRTSIGDAEAFVKPYPLNPTWQARVLLPCGKGLLTFFPSIEAAQSWCEEQLASALP